MKKHIQTILSAVMAGSLIAIAGTIYLFLKSDGKGILGAFLFGFGLLTVVSLNFKLYTGRVGYLIDNDKKYMIEILLIILGNMIGGLLIASILYLSNYQVIIDQAKAVVDIKLSRNILEIFGLSILCGMMMYLGVDGYKRAKNDTAKVVINIFAVAIFVILGFEHSIANIFYFYLANQWSWYMVIAYIIMILGNGLGAILLNGIEKLGKTKFE
ncbi:formate/nitrite transporter family protein [Acholeplasma granularum]|uniref:formate/nitrite transporter family protein n=1 Tax=Acholeplasma granularum TaxID=264635 RepID=UPI00046ED7EA|nr:formate/nitrite transporter family protein [Acholeplasma granularum]